LERKEKKNDSLSASKPTGSLKRVKEKGQWTKAGDPKGKKQTPQKPPTPRSIKRKKFQSARKDRGHHWWTALNYSRFTQRSGGAEWEGAAYVFHRLKRQNNCGPSCTLKGKVFFQTVLMCKILGVRTEKSGTG